MCVVVFLLSRSRRLSVCVCVYTCYLLPSLHVFLIFRPKVFNSTTWNQSCGRRSGEVYLLPTHLPSVGQGRIATISWEDDVCSERITRGDGYYRAPAGSGNVVFVL